MNDITLQSKQPPGYAGYNFQVVRVRTHMFLAGYKNVDWQNARIKSFHLLSLSPFAACFHYGQTVFEDMKVYRLPDDNVSVYRPAKNCERLHKSLVRFCMPLVPEGLFMDTLRTLVAFDIEWVSAAYLPAKRNL
jgi:branched-chain amino acid aminotransferase